jgi:hypothetical protein
MRGPGLTSPACRRRATPSRPATAWRRAVGYAVAACLLALLAAPVAQSARGGANRAPSAARGAGVPATGACSLACCALHSLALRSDGQLLSWGNDSDGQLGRPVDGAHHSQSPSQVGDGREWAAVACGSYHTMALKRDGTLWSWGNNDTGQLGRPVSAEHPARIPGQVGTADDWTAIDCGGYHSVALRSDGTLWAWGNNGWGQLGLGDRMDRAAPVQVGTAADWAAFDCGGAHVLALKRDGTLWTWGSNDDGQLGRTGNALSPGRVGTESTWRSVVGGSVHSVAIRGDGTLWSWGSDDHGQLGRSGDPGTPGQVGVDHDWTAAACSYHTLALKSSGTLWSWGDNADGQLGRPGDTQTPGRVGDADDWVAVGSGRYHSLALAGDATLLSWGDNEYGQLGDGSFDDSGTPLDVLGLDATAPSVVADGVPSTWVRKTPVTVTLTATDAASGVKEIVYRSDDAAWSTSSGAGPAHVPIAIEGPSTLSFSATDNAGNRADVQTATIRIDTVGPRTLALGPVSVRKGARARFRFRIEDVTATARAEIRILQGSRPRTVLAAGVRATGTDLEDVWKCKLAKGRYTWRVYAVDQAGNPAISVGSSTLTVR